MTTLGYIGEKLDLLIRQDATLGSFDATMRNPDGSAVNLIGATIRGQVRRKALGCDLRNRPQSNSSIVKC